MKLSKFSVLVGFDVERLYEGGVIAALADTAAAIAAYTVAPKGVELATIELKINYLLPIAQGKVEAEGKVLRAGRNFIVVECDIRNAQGQLAAKALMTFGGAGARTPQTASE